MACKACEKRRQMISEARKRDGLVGVVKVMPAVLNDIRSRTVRKRRYANH